MPTVKRKQINKNVFNFLLILFLTLSTVVSGFNIYKFINRSPRVVVVNVLKNDITYWQDIVKNNPTYRDGYIILSKLYLEDNQLKTAQNLIRKAYTLDPLNESVKETGFVLGIKNF